MKQPIPGKQLVMLTDASFSSAGYALMIEDNPDQKNLSKRKTYALVAFGSKLFSPAQLKLSIYSKDLLAIYIAFLRFAHILWETIKPTIVLTEIKFGIRPQQRPILLRKKLKNLLTKQRWATKMFAKMVCRLTSEIKHITTKRPTLQNSRKQTIFMSCCRKPIIKEINPFTEFRWIGPYNIEKVLTKQNLSGTQSWHQQDANASPHAIASVHTQITSTRSDNQTSRMVIWSGSDL